MSIIRRRSAAAIGGGGTPSRLPDGYKELQCIQSTNCQAAFKVPFATYGGYPGFLANIRCIYDSAATANGVWVGMYNANTKFEWGVFRYRGSEPLGEPTAAFMFYDITGTARRYSLAFNLENDFKECSCINGTFTSSDGTTTTVPECKNNSRSSYIAIGSSWYEATSTFASQIRDTVQIAYLALYHGETMEYEFIPARRLSDSKVGMYDLVNNVFHSSETSTEFVDPNAITVTVTATKDTITATADRAVTTTTTITLTGELSTTITINSGETVGTASIVSTKSGRLCNLTISPQHDSTYDYVLSSNSIRVPGYGQDLPSEYVELQYITSNKQTAAFHVTYTLNANSGFKMRVHNHDKEESTTKFTAYFGIYKSGSGGVDAGVGISASNSSSNKNVLRIYNSAASGNCDLKYNYNGDYVQEASLINNVVTKFDGTTQSGYNWGVYNSYAVNANFGIFAHYDLNNGLVIDSARGSKTFAYLALYNGSTITYEFIPAKRTSDNKIGMYDLVNNIFHSSETNTEFVAGPELT